MAVDRGDAGQALRRADLGVQVIDPRRAEGQPVERQVEIGRGHVQRAADLGGQRAGSGQRAGKRGRQRVQIRQLAETVRRARRLPEVKLPSPLTVSRRVQRQLAERITVPSAARDPTTSSLTFPGQQRVAGRDARAQFLAGAVQLKLTLRAASACGFDIERHRPAGSDAEHLAQHRRSAAAIFILPRERRRPSGCLRRSATRRRHPRTGSWPMQPMPWASAVPVKPTASGP